MSLDPGPKISKLRILGFGLETTNGAPATIAGADCVSNVFGGVPLIKYSTEKVAREPQGGLSAIKQARGARSGTCTFETELVGAGASGSGPIWTRLMQACGWQNNGGVWTPLDNAQQTITFAEFINGRRRLLAGCMGTFVLKLRRGAPARFSWTFTGVQAPTSDVALPTPTYVSVDAARVGASVFTIGAVANYRVPEIEIDAGNKVILREDIGAADSNSLSLGYRCAYIPGREVMVKASPEALVLATKNWTTDFQAGTTAALALTIGAASNNTFAFAAPNMQLVEDPSEEDRDGMLAEGLHWLCLRNGSAGVDELSITQS